MSPSSLAHTRFQIGSWTVDPRANELLGEDGSVRIEPKVMALLVALAEQAGTPVSRDDLLACVWPDVVVTEDALSRAVSKLRRALGDEAVLVETIPKVGYRLKASVTAPSRGASGKGTRKSLRWLVLGGLVILVCALAVGLMRQRTAPGPPTARIVTHLPGIETHPALSPDGQRLAFIAQGRDEAGVDLWVTTFADEQPQRLTEGPEVERHPAWNADGTALAFLRCEGATCAAYTMSASGGGARRISDAALGLWGLGWFPDGEALAAIARVAPDRPYRLVRIDAATGAVDSLTTPPEQALGDLFPAVHPEGHTLAFVRHGNAGEEDVWVQPLGGAARRLTTDGVPLDGLAWTPDGEAVVFASRRSGTDRLWRVPLAGGEPEPLPIAVGAARLPTMAAGRLAVEARTTEVNLYVGEAGQEGLEPAVVSTSRDAQPAIAPEGDRLVFVSDRSGSPELWTVQVDGTELIRLTDFGGARLGAPRWSPMDGQIVFEAQEDGLAVIYRIAAEGGAPVRLTEGAGYALAPRVSRDGQHVYFGSDHDGSWRLWRVPMVGGEPEAVAPPGYYVGEEAVTGDALWLNRYREPGLWRMASGGTPQQADSLLTFTDWGSWRPTTQGVLLLERSAEGTRLIRLDPGTGTRTVVQNDLGALPTREPAFDATPDGQRYVIARVDRIESHLVLVSPIE